MFKITEDRPTPPEVYNLRIYLIATVPACGSLLFGYDSAFIGSLLALPSFISDFGLDKLSSGHLSTISANIVSIFQAGCFFGVLFAFPLGEWIGRRAVIQVACLVFLVGVILEMISHHDLGPFYAGRVITGLGVGAITLAAPVYLSEISPPPIRGRLVGLYELAYQVAALLGFWINYGVNKHVEPTRKQWLIPVGIQLIVVLVLAGTFFIPETPRFLLKQGKEPQALSTLVSLRQLPGDHIYISEEIYAIRHQLEHENVVAAAGAGASFWAKCNAVKKELLRKGIRNRIVIGCLLMLGQNATGINAINYYSPTIFKSIGVSGTDSGLFATGIYGVVKLISSFIFLVFLIDYLGRRLPLLIGGVCCSLCLFYVGGYIKIADPHPQPGSSPDSGGVSAIAFIFLFVFIYCMSWNGIAWIYCAELFPTRIRGICAVLTTCFQWLGQFAITRSTPYALEALGWGLFIFFGGMTLLFTVFVFFFIKETKGVSLEHMDRLFGFNDGSQQDIEQITKGIGKIEEDDHALSEVASSSLGDEKSAASSVEIENKAL